MKHLNGNLICSIDIETTGLNAFEHEIYQLAVVPLDNMLNPHPRYLPFLVNMKPDKVETIDWDGVKKVGGTNRLKEALKTGIDKFKCADYLVEWFDALKLPEFKKICPLAQNWAGIDKAFIQEWLGQQTFDMLFSPWYRDTMSAALFLNDRADILNERVPFPKVNLSYLCSQLNVPHVRAHDATADALVTAEVYKKLIRL